MLTPKEYTPRHIDKKVEEYLTLFSAVCIEGPKWCGKTWTSLAHSESFCSLADPSRGFSNRIKAQNSPELILEGEQPRLIDEWQEVPSLWDAVRFASDTDSRKGKYLLTGSSTPKRKGILHSGAGRIASLRMETMTLCETGDSDAVISLFDLITSGRITKPVNCTPCSLRTLIHYCIRGGWPGNRNTPPKKSGRIPQEYLRSVIENEFTLPEAAKLNKQKMKLLLYSLARNESTVVSNATLSRDILSHDGESAGLDTIAGYLDIFARMFLIEEQPSFNPSLRSKRRILKAPKRHFCDPSLAAAALSATPEMLENDLKTFGFLFEALCEHDLRIYADVHDGRLYHFRDEKGNEIDAIVEFPDGKYGAFEIKLGAHQIDDAAENLKKIAAIIEREEGNVPAVLGVICGMCDCAYTREDGVSVLPLTALKP